MFALRLFFSVLLNIYFFLSRIFVLFIVFLDELIFFICLKSVMKDVTIRPTTIATPFFRTSFRFCYIFFGLTFDWCFCLLSTGEKKKQRMFYGMTKSKLLPHATFVTLWSSLLPLSICNKMPSVRLYQMHGKMLLLYFFFFFHSLFFVNILYTSQCHRIFIWIFLALYEFWTPKVDIALHVILLLLICFIFIRTYVECILFYMESQWIIMYYLACVSVCNRAYWKKKNGKIKTKTKNYFESLFMRLKQKGICEKLTQLTTGTVHIHGFCLLFLSTVCEWHALQDKNSELLFLLFKIIQIRIFGESEWKVFFCFRLICINGDVNRNAWLPQLINKQRIYFSKITCCSMVYNIFAE